MLKVMLVIVVTLLSLGCDSQITSPTRSFSDFDAKGPVVVTPDNRFAIYAHELGYVNSEHVEMAQESWNVVSSCVGVNAEELHNYPILLLASQTDCVDPFGNKPPSPPGLTGKNFFGCMFWGTNYGHIEVLGKDSEAWWWKHEMVHLALGIRDGGDIDVGHEKPEWGCER